jgi:hypothetical protein
MNKSEPPARATFNINFIKDNINKINEIINEMKSQGNTNIVDHELEVLNRYPDFYQSYPFLVKKVCKGDYIQMLETMFSNLEQVESGNKTLESVEYKLGQKLASQYLDPTVKDN